MITLPVEIDSGRCTGCGECVRACPFGALKMQDGVPVVLDSCRACGACEKICPASAVRLLDMALVSDGEADKASGADEDGGWSGILVYLQTDEDGRLLPVAYELASKASELAGKKEEEVWGLAAAAGMRDDYRKIPGIGKLFVALGAQYSQFSYRIFSELMIRCILRCRPSVVLFGATPEGRSIAPAAAVYFRTGLTADCTELRMDEDGNLIQIRPAFGGNVMAEILTPRARPQMATVRQGVMAGDHPAPEERYPVEILENPPCERPVSRTVERTPAGKGGMADAEFIVAAGGGIADRKDIDRLRRWAEKNGAAFGCSRKLVERGWMPGECQIGLSGNSVAPKLLITFGVSGSVQFLAGIRRAEYVVAVDCCEDAPIFGRANKGILADLYDVLTELEKPGSEKCCE